MFWPRNTERRKINILSRTHQLYKTKRPLKRSLISKEVVHRLQKRVPASTKNIYHHFSGQFVSYNYLIYRWTWHHHSQYQQVYFVPSYTGSGTGIGKATAIRFAKLGARLVLVGRILENLQQTKDECMQQSELKEEDILCVSADVGSETDLDNVVAKTVAHFGGIDILVNNAGHGLYDTVETFNVDYFDSLMRVHVRGVGYLTKIASPHLIERKGSIVNVSSVGAFRPVTGFISYCSAKAAMNQMTKCAAHDLGPKGVRVNAVNPGVVITEIAVRMGIDRAVYEMHAEKSKDNYPLKRLCQPEEVASVISFLASSDASFVNGVCLPVDGGLTDTIKS